MRHVRRLVFVLRWFGLFAIEDTVTSGSVRRVALGRDLSKAVVHYFIITVLQVLQLLVQHFGLLLDLVLEVAYVDRSLIPFLHTFLCLLHALHDGVISHGMHADGLTFHGFQAVI